MNRLYCLVITASTFVLTSSLVGHSVRGLSPAEMNALRGGNAKTGKYTGDCGVVTGVYIGCTKVGGNCAQCIDEDEMGNPFNPPADYIGIATLNHPGFYEEKQDEQHCGNVYRGNCVTDPLSPTGFKCNLADTGSVCSDGVAAVDRQD